MSAGSLLGVGSRKHKQGMGTRNKGQKLAIKGNTGEQVTAMANGDSWAGLCGGAGGVCCTRANAHGVGAFLPTHGCGSARLFPRTSAPILSLSCELIEKAPGSW